MSEISSPGGDPESEPGKMSECVPTAVQSTKRDALLPNGKIKCLTDENGIVPHLLTASESFKECDKVETEPLDDHQTRSCATKVAQSSKSPMNSDPSAGYHSCNCEVEPDRLSDQITSLTAGIASLDGGQCTDFPKDAFMEEGRDVKDGIEYVVYESELQMPDIMRLITKDLSEPYSIYTYRYFIHNWPKLCFLAMDGEKCIGAIVCKLDMHKKMVRRGYIAMLAVDSEYRRKKIGSHLVLKAIKAMITDDCDEVVLETEITNQAALRLYENLGFVRDKRLFRYYLNGVDALRLKLWLR